MKRLAQGVLAPLLIAATLLAALEFAARAAGVGRLGTRADLFVNRAFGPSIGNAPNAATVAFGVAVHTDAAGWRAAAPGPAPAGDGALLLFGDSVAFGVGVPFGFTLAARLERTRPVLNTAVIGYGVDDYVHVARVLLPRLQGRPAAAVLVMCPNDVSVTSAAEIRREVAHAAPLRTAGFVDVPALKRSPLLVEANRLLRARSSLYVTLRGWATDPPGRYWRMLLDDYARHTPVSLAAVLAPLATLAAQLRAAGVPLTVFVTPYAAQLRPGQPDLPQRMIAAYLAAAGIAGVDLLPAFRREADAEGLFLPFDPMHLSARGHALTAEAIERSLRQP